MSGSLDRKRVPSGNIHSDVLVDNMCFPATSMERIALALFPRLIKIVPDSDIKGPRGENWRDFFAIITVCFGISLRFPKLEKKEDMEINGKVEKVDEFQTYLPMTRTSSMLW